MKHVKKYLPSTGTLQFTAACAYNTHIHTHTIRLPWVPWRKDVHKSGLFLSIQDAHTAAPRLFDVLVMSTMVKSTTAFWDFGAGHDAM